jgi:hypothetical protein
MNIDTTYIQNLHIALTALAAVHTGRNTEFHNLLLLSMLVPRLKMGGG